VWDGPDEAVIQLPPSRLAQKETRGMGEKQNAPRRGVGVRGRALREPKARSSTRLLEVGPGVNLKEDERNICRCFAGALGGPLRTKSLHVTHGQLQTLVVIW
jgi:hypothetical protein